MEILIFIVLLAFVIGLIARRKGSGFLDTLSSGCSTIVILIILAIVVIVALVMAA
jgi:hypothetical protein